MLPLSGNICIGQNTICIWFEASGIHVGVLEHMPHRSVGRGGYCIQIIQENLDQLLAKITQGHHQTLLSRLRSKVELEAVSREAGGGPASRTLYRSALVQSFWLKDQFAPRDNQRKCPK